MSDIPERIWIHPADPMQFYVIYDSSPSSRAVPYRRDDQVCVWRPVAPEELPEVIVWVPACENTGMAEPTYDYCPFCGNRIQVGEV